jgi:hypothetical protein
MSPGLAMRTWRRGGKQLALEPVGPDPHSKGRAPLLQSVGVVMGKTEVQLKSTWSDYTCAHSCSV